MLLCSVILVRTRFPRGFARVNVDLIWTISAVLINMFGLGLILSYPTCLLPALNGPDSPIKADLHASSWLGSIVSIAGIPGFPIASVLMSSCGRRVTHGLVILPAIAGWLLIYFATDMPMLMIGRFLGGLTAIPAVSLGAIMIGEFTCPDHRGVFLNLKNVSVCFGVMFMHIISRYLHWRTVALISLTPLLIALLITCTWFESPSWLASKRQYERSQEAFYWLRGNSVASQKEIEEIIQVQEAHRSKTEGKSNFSGNILKFFQKFTRKDFLKPSLIIVLATTVLEMSGKHIFPVYAQQIMSDLTGESFQSFYYTLTIDVIITASAVLASFLVKIMNRRTLLFSSGFAALVVLIIFCVYLSLISKEIITVNKPWIAIGLLMSFFILVNFGCTPIPLVLIGEVYPLPHREVGSALSGIWVSLCLLAALKSAPYLLISIKVYGCFAVYGCILGVCLVILYFILPETKGKTLQEIDNYFNYGTFTRADNGDGDPKTEAIETITMSC